MSISLTAPSAARYEVALIGAGISASLTPAMHEREARLLGFDYRYRVLDLLELRRPAESVGRLLLEARDSGLAALNITHPCKQLVLPHLDELSPAAAQLGAVNLVLLRDGRFVGDNTDWTGFRAAMQEGLPGARRDRVVQVGAGGAGAATAYALLTLGTSRLMIVDVSPDRAGELGQKLAPLFPDQEVTALPSAQVTDELGRADGVVQATPIGMVQHPGVPFDPRALAAEAWVAEVVYRPIETELLRTARILGHPVLDGGRMAVGQAADSIRLITGAEPDRTRMREHFLALLADDAAAFSAAGRP